MVGKRWIVPLSAGLLMVHCEKKAATEQDPGQTVIGGDTLAVQTVMALALGRDTAAAQRKSLERQVMLARQDETTGRPADSGMAKELASALAMRTGGEVAPAAAASLIRAARQIARQMETSGSVDALTRELAGRAAGDSLPSDTATAAADSTKVAERLLADLGSSLPDKECQGENRIACLSQLITNLLDLDREIAATVASFVAYDTLPPVKTPAMATMVEGLVFDSARHAARMENQAQASRSSLSAPARSASAAAPVLRKVANPEQALLHRPYTRIRDTIQAHIPNLKALYKKRLKTVESLAGTVYLTFEVKPSGLVSVVEVKSSELGDAVLHARLLEYARMIQFNPIPEEVGVMSFDFPLEFSPDS